MFVSPKLLGRGNQIGGYLMERKHNTKLTPTARMLRKSMTKEERRLWYDFLRSYPVRFLRQKVIDNYIVDFYCHDARLVIELDGSQHYSESGMLKDKIRTERIEERDLTVVRIPNNEIDKNFNGVCEYIDLLITKNVK
jgi:very-short-patch-repair endonuclease